MDYTAWTERQLCVVEKLTGLCNALEWLNLNQILFVYLEYIFKDKTRLWQIGLLQAIKKLQNHYNKALL